LNADSADQADETDSFKKINPDDPLDQPDSRSNKLFSTTLNAVSKNLKIGARTMHA
jgi:hypothetical protein